MKTKILVHGYNPKEPNWERVIWGEPPDKPGRVPMAVAAAIESNGELIIFHATDGSGPMMIKYWEDHCNQFGEFTCFDILKRISVDDIIATLNIQIVENSERQSVQNYRSKQYGPCSQGLSRFLPSIHRSAQYFSSFISPRSFVSLWT